MRGSTHVFLFSMFSRVIYCVFSCAHFVILSDVVFIFDCIVLRKVLSCVTLSRILLFNCTFVVLCIDTGDIGTRFFDYTKSCLSSDEKSTIWDF